MDSESDIIEHTSLTLQPRLTNNTHPNSCPQTKRHLTSHLFFYFFQRPPIFTSSFFFFLGEKAIWYQPSNHSH